MVSTLISQQEGHGFDKLCNPSPRVQEKRSRKMDGLFSYILHYLHSHAVSHNNVYTQQENKTSHKYFNGKIIQTSRD